MNLENKIKNWFDGAWGCGLMLPNGWFGRPFDNIHQLTRVVESSDSLELVLDNQLTLKFEGVPNVLFTHNELIIYSFRKLIFNWIAYGSMKSYLNEFDFGEVKFIAPQINPEANQ